MANDSMLIRLNSLLFDTLVSNVPILSGNMSNHIKQEIISENEHKITINAPRYNLKLWEQTHRIVFIGGKEYAIDVERAGGFFTFNKSKGWVERSIREVVYAIANMYGATVNWEIGGDSIV